MPALKKSKKIVWVRSICVHIYQDTFFGTLVQKRYIYLRYKINKVVFLFRILNINFNQSTVVFYYVHVRILLDVYYAYISLKSSHVKLKVKAESFYIDSESTFKRLFAAVAPLPSPTFVHALLSFSFFANASVNWKTRCLNKSF